MGQVSSFGILFASNFANPSALVGLAPVNGVALTAMRSDAAPALDQGISPTWTGNHIFAPASGNTIFSAGQVRITNDNQELQIGAAQDLRLYHDGTDSIIRNDTAGLVFMEGALEAGRFGTSGNFVVGGNFAPMTRGIWTNGVGALSGIGAARFSADANGPSLEFTKSRGATLGTNTIVQNGDTLGRIVAYGANGTGYDNAAEIRFAVNAAPGASGDMPGRISLLACPDGTAVLAESGRFDGNAGANETRFMLFDVTAGALVRVSRGAADSGGAGFRLLRVPN